MGYFGMKNSILSPKQFVIRLIVSLALLVTLIFSTPAMPVRADDAGFALAFDGENDLVQLTYTSTIMASTWTTTKTVEVWVKPEGPVSDCIDEPGDPAFVAACDYVFGDKPEWWGITRGEISGQDRIWLYNFDGNMDQIGIPYTTGEWVHIAMVHNGGVLRAYKNGVEVGSIPSDETLQPSTGALPVLVVGGSIFNSSRVYTLQGQIDELRLWNVARSAAEINANMRSLLNGDEAGLAAYYQMSDGVGTTLTDDSINNNNGTLLDGCCGVAPNGLPPQWVDSGAFDAVPPSVTINQAAGQADPTNNSPILFSVLFSENVTGFSGSDVDLSASTAPGPLSAVVTGSGASYTVEVSGMSASGAVIASIPAGVAQNASGIGNNASTSTDNTVTYDNVPPTVTINQAAGQADPAFTSPINFQVIFGEPVSGFTNGDVSLSGTAGATTAVVTGGPSTYNVAVSGMTGSGTVIATIAAGRASDAAGNLNTASTSTDNQVTYDSTGLTVTINQAAGQADPTNAAPINFQVVFNRSVTDFATGDVSLSGTAGASSATVSGSGTTYNVAVTGMTSSGTVIASIPAGVAHDGGGIPNAASTSTDNTVTYDTVAPTVTIDQAAGQADPTNASPVQFTAVFSEAVTNFTSTDVTVTGSAQATTVLVTGGPTTYNIMVSGMALDGTVTVAIPGGAAQDAAGNLNIASTCNDDTVTYDTLAPTVAINQASSQTDPTIRSPINFTVVFSEAVSGFATGDVSLSGTAGATTATVTGSGTTYNVAVSGMTASGTVIASIIAGVAQDAAGNLNTASTSADNIVTYALYWIALPLSIR
jgi:hypothetical protein